MYMYIHILINIHTILYYTICTCIYAYFIMYINIYYTILYVHVYTYIN